MPHAHALPHNLKKKKVVVRCDVPLIFTAPKILGSLCVRPGPERRMKRSYVSFYVNRCVDCQVGVAYGIPISCGRSYLGRTGWCVNERLRKHYNSLHAIPSGNLAVWRSRSACAPSFPSANLLAREGDKVCGEIIEAPSILGKERRRGMSALLH